MLPETFVTGLDDKERQLRSIGDLTNEGVSVLCGKSKVAVFGELLHNAWQVKRDLSSKVSNSDIEEIYAEAMSAGRDGRKTIGCRWGRVHTFFRAAIQTNNCQTKTQQVDLCSFKFESSGSQIIFFDPEQDYSREERARIFQPDLVFRELSSKAIT